jgi:hypothetical protein
VLAVLRADAQHDADELARVEAGQAATGITVEPA